ncbi:TPM domain-containing protein [Mucilaginibacter sp. CSA2-8R]|uniref:TPM domain-containing protein n=1 Tax=Mucilaginibacter sp. CSA2-8R TaxID=3141542 RepID=UPI00315CD3CA
MKSLLLLLSLLTATLGFAKIPEPQKNTYVNDYAHVLSKKQIEVLNERIRKFENKTTVQLAVVLVNYVPSDYTIDEFATVIGRRWHVGTNDNGLVYVLAIKQRLQRLEVARNLQATITDADAEQILDTVKANLRSKHYGSAIYNIVEASDRTIANAHPYESVKTDDSATTENVATSHSTARDNTGGIVLGCFLVYLIIVYFYNKGKPSQGYFGSSNSYNSSNYNSHIIIQSNNRSSGWGSSRLSSGSSNDNGSSSSDSNSGSSYGNWGSTSSGSSSSSSSSGFNGGGATSSW